MIQPHGKSLRTQFRWRNANKKNTEVPRYADTAAFAFDAGHLHAGPAQDIPFDSTFPYEGDERVTFSFVHENMPKEDILELKANDSGPLSAYITPIRIDLMV